jgi:spore germination cell wall hydrolase CwlJ-like protein
MTETASKSETNQVDMASIFRFVPQMISFICVFLIITVVTGAKLTELQSDLNGQAWRQGFVSMDDRSRQLECLAKNIYWEAATESFEGKVGVAQVTLNRVESGQFAKDICGVVYQKNIVYEKVVCQFSWYCEPHHRVKPVHPALYQESMEVAKKVLLEGFRLPGLKEALYYHADYVNPNWKNKEKIVKIGAHIFYRPRGERT